MFVSVQAAQCRQDGPYKQHRPAKNKLEPADAIALKF
jgi:hypothetical protein